MLLQQIGKWLITEEGIEWTGGNEYFIDKDRILEAGPQNRQKMYDWLVHMTEKSWLSVEDIYALNTAFIYAIEYFNLSFDKLSFVETLKLQEQQLNYKRKE